MDHEIIWSASATADLEAIVRYLARRSQRAAEAVRTAILSHVETLARFPSIGPIYQSDRSEQTREIFCQSYRILYRVDESLRRVHIMMIWHAARGEPQLPDGEQ